MKTIYDLRLSLLTPLHIGSGETLLSGFDYAVHDQKTWVLDADRFADHVLGADETRFDKLLQGIPPANLLQPSDFQQTHLFRYIMPGVPHRSDTGAEIKAHIKTVFNRPYLPGSSLKGALRTLLFRQAFRLGGQQLRPQDLGRSRSWAAQGLEHELLSTAVRRGDAPNYSLLRALQVADSDPVGAETLLLAKARVFGHHKTGAPINLECLRPDTELTATLTIDNYLFDDAQAAKKLNFASRREWLQSLADLANEQARRRIQQEINFYRQRGANQAGSFYQALHGLLKQPAPGQFVIQVGWGGGWDSKTLSYLLPDKTRDAVVEQYRLARNYFKAGETPFPRTRRAVGRGQGEQIEPLRPFGWLLVDMKERT